jgi:hypothetical protein
MPVFARATIFCAGLFAFSISGCFSASEGRTWVATTEDGDKPGVGYVLFEMNDKIKKGNFYILNPQYPHDLTEGIRCEVNNLKQQGNTVMGDVTVLDGSSKTKSRHFHFSINFAGGFCGDKIKAEILVDGEGKPEILFFNKAVASSGQK